MPKGKIGIEVEFALREDEMFGPHVTDEDLGDVDIEESYVKYAMQVEEVLVSNLMNCNVTVTTSLDAVEDRIYVVLPDDETAYCEYDIMTTVQEWIFTVWSAFEWIVEVKE